MDISNITKNLHPLEIKVLLHYSDKDELTSERLIKELDYILLLFNASTTTNKNHFSSTNTL